MKSQCLRLLVRHALFSVVQGADAAAQRSRRIAVAVVLAFVLLATGCGTASNRSAETRPAAPSPAVDPDPSRPGTAGGSQDVAASSPTSSPVPGSTLAIISELQPVIPPPEVAEQVLAAASHPAPESELSPPDCTDWIADPAISLEPVQTQECAAMLAAAVDTCRELDCFAAPADTVPPDTAPADTVPPDTAPADTVPPDTAPADTVPPDTAPADTVPPDTAPADTVPPDTAPADTVPPDTAPADTVPPDTAPADTVPPDTAPADTVPPDQVADLTDCFTPLPDAGVSGICASRRPDGPPHQELPRQTRDAIDWTNR